MLTDKSIYVNVNPAARIVEGITVYFYFTNATFSTGKTFFSIIKSN